MNDQQRQRVSRVAKSSRESLADIVLVVMVSVWAFSQIYSAFNLAYEPPDGLHQLIMVICGFLFGHRMGTNGNGNGHTTTENCGVKP